MRSPAYVVSTGVITAIGSDTDSCCKSLMTDQHGINYPLYLKTYWQHELPVGEVKMSNQALANITGMDPSLPRTALLSAVAVKEAWGFLMNKASGLRTGFFSANTVGGMDITEDLYQSFKRESDYTHINKVVHHEC